MDETPLFLIRILLARLERIQADSVWAHRASGVRGSLLRVLERVEAGQAVHESRIEVLTQNGFKILEGAAHENYYHQPKAT